MRSINFLILIGIVFITSCDQEDAEPKNSFAGKNYDEQLLGKWEREYLISDFHNSITVVLDTIIFQEVNTGTWETFYFDQLHERRNLSFYTDKDSLFIQFETDSELLQSRYSLKEDTLFLTSPVPDSLQHLDSSHLTRTFNKIR